MQIKLLMSHTHTHTHILTCGLWRGPKFMLGVDVSDTDGEPREEVMTE